MNVVYVSNDGYVEHLAAGLHSVYAENRDSVVNAFVVSVGIKEENADGLRAISESFGQTLHIIEFSDIADKLGFDAEGERFNISTFGRFFLGDLLPEPIDRVIYMDSDTVVTGSLKGMWEQDLKENVVACAMEPTIYKETKEALGFKAEEPYYNAGVMLIDLDKWRRENTKDRLLEFYKANVGKLKFCDQDAINVILKNRISTLNPKYNFFSNYYYFSYRALVKINSAYDEIGEKNFIEAKEHPSIVHFAGDERPWKAGCRNHYAGVYDANLAETKWADSDKERGSERYMVLYHAMNVVTGICPGVRMAISRSYGRKIYKKEK